MLAACETGDSWVTNVTTKGEFLASWCRYSIERVEGDTCLGACLDLFLHKFDPIDSDCTD